MNGIGGRLRALHWQAQASPVGVAWLLHDWQGLFGVRGVASPLDPVWAVRRDWPDGGHELVCPRRRQGAAFRALAADAAYWCRGPVRPEVSLVRLTLVEFRAHPGRCRSLVCPTAGWSLALAGRR